MKVLLLEPGNQSTHERRQRLEAERAGSIPRWSDFERAFGTQSVDLKLVEQSPWFRRAVYAFLPRLMGLAIEAYVRSQDYDVVVTAWSEHLSLYFALVQRVFGQRVPHVATFYWFSKRNVAFLMQIVHPAISRIVTWSSVQRMYAISELGIAAERIILVQHPVDPVYWSKQNDRSRDLGNEKRYICSAGAEMRDYPTLIEAMRGVPGVLCNIAAREIRIYRGLKARRVSPDSLAETLPANVSIRAHKPLELRDLVQTSQFVVVPLLPSDTDNGITVILEAMAAGKTVVCSRTRGQVDAIKDGSTGIFVEQGNPEALRQAIRDLWEHPEKAIAIGKNAQEYIRTSRHSLDLFAGDVAAVARSVCRNGVQ